MGRVHPTPCGVSTSGLSKRMGQQVSGWIMSMIMLVITRTRQGLVIMREGRSSSVRSGPPWGKGEPNCQLGSISRGSFLASY